MKEIKKKLKLQIQAGEAKAVPPLGPILSQAGINPALFIKEFNLQTQEKKGEKLNVKITLFIDKTYVMEILTPPISALIKNEIVINNLDTKNLILSDEFLLNIFNKKKNEFNTKRFDKAKKMIQGTIKNIKFKI